jgi:hypothetical protein
LRNAPFPSIYIIVVVKSKKYYGILWYGLTKITNIISFPLIILRNTFLTYHIYNTIVTCEMATPFAPKVYIALFP